MVFPWFSHGFPMVFPWFSHGFPMVFPWFSPHFSKSPGHQPHDPWHHFVGLRLLGLRQHRGEQQRRQATELVPVDQGGLDRGDRTGGRKGGTNGGTPIAGWFMMENPMKMDENEWKWMKTRGVALFQPYFRKKNSKYEHTVDGRNHAPPWLKPYSYKSWDEPSINWCKISSIHSIMVQPLTLNH